MEGPLRLQDQEANGIVSPVSYGHLQERPSLQVLSITLNSERVTWISRTLKSNLSNLRLRGNGSIRKIVGSQARDGLALIHPDGTTVVTEMMEDIGGPGQDEMAAPAHSGRHRDILAGGVILWRMTDHGTRITGLVHRATAAARQNIATGQTTMMTRDTVGQPSAGALERAFVKVTVAVTTLATAAMAVSPMAVATMRSDREIVASGIGRMTAAIVARTRGTAAVVVVEIAVEIVAEIVVETVVGTVVGTEVVGAQGVDETAIVTGAETDHTTTAGATGSCDFLQDTLSAVELFLWKH